MHVSIGKEGNDGPHLIHLMRAQEWWGVMAHMNDAPSQPICPLYAICCGHLHIPLIDIADCALWETQRSADFLLGKDMCKALREGLC